ncbi:class C sortase [Macrococcus hajekii]|uniref:Class C sortase n=1 Tax=Macrococcus hajekii TaxID=198482 RepID=A0A4R6BJD2_9STAP|nr:class C sortase [Macrococcus hajekii]TDM01805.1 class C sortase [Macrococcus hajekii]GGB07612.1 class C sortase [Macrococcus hajekii]
MKKSSIILLFIIGLAICIYPLGTKVYYNYSMSVESEKTDQSFESLSPDKQLKYQTFENYNKRENQQSKIISPAVENKKDESEENLTKHADIIATIRIPALRLHYPVYTEATPENLNRGVSRVIGTSYPLGGNNTNSVLAAHSYSPTHEWFTHIDRLKNGDQIIISNYKEKLYYRVFNRKIVTPDQVESLAVIKNRDILTLMTCTPDGSRRLLIYSERMPFQKKQETVDEKRTVTPREFSLLEKLKVLSDSWVILVLIIGLIWIFLWQVTTEEKNNF